MSRSSFLLVLSVFVGHLISSAYGVPVFILTKKDSRCLQIDVSQEHVITIEFYAPDFAVYKDEDTASAKGRRNMMSFIPLSDIGISVELKQDNKFGWIDKTRKRVKPTGTRTLRQSVEAEKGTMQFYTGNTAGFLDICIQAYKATPSKPRRIGLNIKKKGATLQEQQQNAPLQKKQEEFSDKDLSNSILTVESSHISIELEKLESKMSEMASNAERSKDIEQNFFSKSVDLNKAVVYWPLFRIVVVMIAGFVQAHLVVSYMRSRHIY